MRILIFFILVNIYFTTFLLSKNPCVNLGCMCVDLKTAQMIKIMMCTHESVEYFKKAICKKKEGQCVYVFPKKHGQSGHRFKKKHIVC